MLVCYHGVSFCLFCVRCCVQPDYLEKVNNLITTILWQAQLELCAVMATNEACKACLATTMGLFASSPGATALMSISNVLATSAGNDAWGACH